MDKIRRLAITLIKCTYLIVVAIFMNGVSAADESITKTPFFQYLMNPTPPIKDAIFEKEMFSSAIPEAARKQSFRISMEGENYMLITFMGTNDNQATAGGGSFNGTNWGLVNGDLIFSDPAVNKNRTDVDHQGRVTRMTANLLANLGIYELDRSSLAWDSKSLSFVGKDTSGDGLDISFEFNNQLPKRAIIVTTIDGGVKGFIDYDYSNTICNGELPFQFTRHFGAPGHDLGKTFRVTVSSMELTNSGLVFDPMKLFKPRYLAFYSNNVLYTHDASGKTSKILTTAENQAIIAGIHPGHQKILLVRTFIFSVMLIGLVVLTGFCFMNKQQKKQKQSN